ncbi:MAG TPA: response regulator, partial [Elusimicrobiota bacterium]|nr:response regulator [Elusimicrobiota bacterium]
ERILFVRGPSLVILDVSMPLKDGVTVCDEIRRDDDRVLILMLTGQKKESDKVTGLSVGADDYLTKPFGEKELMARVRSLFRRPNR